MEIEALKQFFEKFAAVDPLDNYHPDTCDPKTCRCLEIAEARNGGQPIKHGYPCLAKKDPDFLNTKKQR